MTQSAPYGSWDSEILPTRVPKLSQLFCDRKSFYHIENRPEEGGRSVIIENADKVILPEGFSARSRVHEYGGGAATARDGHIYFVNDADQNIYHLAKGVCTRILNDPAARFADMVLHPNHTWLYAIQEEHAPGKAPSNTLALVRLDRKGESQVVHAGADFYSMPRLSPDGHKLAFLLWNHPNMPWDGSELWTADITNDGTLGAMHKRAGGPNISIDQIGWTSNGELFYSSDETGFWNVFIGDRNIFPIDADCGYPHWKFCIHRIAALGEHLAIIATDRGIDSLYLFTDTTRTQVALPFTALFTLSATEERFICCGAGPTEGKTLFAVDPQDGRYRRLSALDPAPIPHKTLIPPEHIAFPSKRGETTYAFFYPPHNPNYTAPEGEKPPLLVKAHSGPTGFSDNSLDLAIQFWTSRGFAVCDVNYGGSAGHGRAYRERLNGHWGIVDVDDCTSAAEYLISENLVDSRRCAIMGSSAGGYTALSAATFRDRFTAAISLYGISDLERLKNDMHKFEAYDLHKLLGSDRNVFFQRSPINHIERITIPLLLLQGSEDSVVPPSQSERIYAALLDKGTPVTYTIFEGEGHGFARETTLKRAFEVQLSFLKEHFRIESR